MTVKADLLPWVNTDYIGFMPSLSTNYWALCGENRGTVKTGETEPSH